MNDLTRYQKRKAAIQLDKQQKKTGKGVCKFLTRPSQKIKDITGSGFDTIDTYYYCTELKRRITKKTCHNCQLYKPFTFPT
jgi:hypothetical protein